ncbi:hypothetical protein GQX73_g1610 [Xylaria multiplex]|uniref:G domain-containing protein n=1 Tax=Xylaria multiplex TaxID=323545 RepID=A0A7C8ITK9_9PEZI|nr:hypothetical protein GQX73_g1610 [Xylaria multiplex]
MSEENNSSSDMSDPGQGIAIRPKHVFTLSSSQSFRDGHAPRSTDVFIALMGVTGSGKSSFISACSGTSTVTVYPYKLSPSRTVYLIDTPGFDDTSRSDTEVLDAIATWLGDSYKNKILLHGIIYLHRISDVRMQGSAKRNLLTFKELCGEKALSKVILATTMWDKVAEQEGARREQELKERQEFWGWMISKGSTCHRLDNTAESKKRIVHLLADHDEPVATDIQTQLVDEQRRLDQTDREAQEALEEERDRYTRMIKKAEKNTNALRSTMEELIARRDKKVAEIEKRMKEQQAAHERELKRLKADRARIEKETIKLGKKPSKKKSSKKSTSKNSQKQSSSPGGTKIEIAPLSPYSVVKYGDRFVLTSPKAWHRNSPYPLDQVNSKWRESASFGDDGTWIARFSDQTWKTSQNFTRYYPYVGAKIDSHGLNNLDVCFLGPLQRHFARWRDGMMCCHAAPDLNAHFKKLSSQIVAVAFGFNDSYLFSYGTDPHKLRHYRDLKGYYLGLQQLFEREKGISIIAIALDPMSTTDYIIVYTHYEEDELYHIRWFCSKTLISAAVRDWWNLTIQRYKEPGNESTQENGTSGVQ